MSDIDYEPDVKRFDVWLALGYNLEEAERLEGLAAELVDQGNARDLPHARRAIASVTFQPQTSTRIALRMLGVWDTVRRHRW